MGIFDDLFGGGGKSNAWYQSRQRMYAENAADKARDAIPVEKAANIFKSALGRFDNGRIPTTTFKGGGLTGTVGPAGVNVKRSNEVSSFMKLLKSGLIKDERDLDELLAGVNPGFGLVTDARRQAIEDARQKAVSDLRGNLQRRRIAGSSFANDTIASAEAEFGMQQAQADAQSFLEELDATKQLISQRTDTRQKAIETALTQANFEAGVAAELVARSREESLNTKKVMAELSSAYAKTVMEGYVERSKISSGLRNTVTQGYPDFAKLDTAERMAGQEALTNLVGNLSGAVFGPTLGAVGSKLGDTVGKSIGA